MRIYLLMLFVFLPLLVFSQSKEKIDSLKSKQKPKEKDFGFGFYVEAFLNKSSAKQSQTYQEPEVSTISSFGFGIGYGLFFKMNKRLEFRVLPGMIFQEDHIRFSINKKPFDTLVFKPTTIMLPLHFSLKPFRKQVYVIAGTTSYLDISRGKFAPIQTLPLHRFNQSLDLGLGYLFQAKKFDFVPELRYSHGIVNMAGDKTTSYAYAMANYYRHRISLVLLFK